MLAPRVGIVTALEREVWPAVRRWRANTIEHNRRSFRVFENERAALSCAGMGAAPAAAAAHVLVGSYGPELLISAGFAGALDQKLAVGDLFAAKFVVDAATGRRFLTHATEWGKRGLEVTLVSAPIIAGAGDKTELRSRFGAQAVDMEAAAVAEVAESYGVPFVALKAVSDESGFPLPRLQGFITDEGKFLTARFAAHTLCHPPSWATIWRLWRNAAKASAALCRWLDQYNEAARTRLPMGLHPAAK